MRLSQEATDESGRDACLPCDHLLRNLVEVMSLIEHSGSWGHRADGLLNGRIGLALPHAFFRVPVTRRATHGFIFHENPLLSFRPSDMVHRLVFYHA